MKKIDNKYSFIKKLKAWFELSELNITRLKIFVSRKLGFYSLILFLTMFVLSLFAEVFVNDQPLLIKLNNKIYFPIFNNYSEKAFGGDFESFANYHDQYLIDLIEDQGGFIIMPLIPYSYNTHISFSNKEFPSAPDWDNWLGTDDQGRDVVARLVYGFRISVVFGLVLTFFSSIIGIAVGLVQGYLGGRVDLYGQRLIEIWGSMPSLYILIILSSLINPNLIFLLFILLLFSWMSLVGLVRAEALKVRNYDYIRSAKALGLSELRIMLKHVLPNALTATITFMPFLTASSLVTLTALDFLGFGLPPGSPSLGELLLQGKNNLQSPWLGIVSFSVISLTLLLLVFIGDALRDAYDPKKTIMSSDYG